jgi:hypothetical protein
MSIRIQAGFTTPTTTGQAEAAAVEATRIVFSELNGRFQDAIGAKVWAWPRNLPTRGLPGATLREKLAAYNRGQGTAPGSPRNIVDSGSLRQSNLFRLQGFTGEFSWSAKYAGYVHEGARIHPWGDRSRRVYLPGRPWTSAVLGSELISGVPVHPTADRLRDVWLALIRSR